MADVFDKDTRSAVMGKVRSNGNKSTELRLIRIFKECNIKGWRRNYPIKGRPDFVFSNNKIAVFVDGCFWHGHDCRNVTPDDNKEFWDKKLSKNKERDISATERLTARGWKVIRIWECELKKKNEQIAKDKINGAFGASEK